MGAIDQAVVEASTSSTTRSAARPQASPVPTRSPSCSPPMPASGSRHRTATTVPARRPVGSPGQRAVGDIGRREHPRPHVRERARLGNDQILTGASITAGTVGTARSSIRLTSATSCASRQAVQTRRSRTRSCCASAAATPAWTRARRCSTGRRGDDPVQPDNVQALVTDTHWVPSIHVNFTSGAPSRRTSTGRCQRPGRAHRGQEGAAQGSAMADFSSRGRTGRARHHQARRQRPGVTCWPATRRHRACSTVPRGSCSSRSPARRWRARTSPGCSPCSARRTPIGPLRRRSRRS